MMSPLLLLCTAAFSTTLSLSPSQATIKLGERASFTYVGIGYQLTHFSASVSMSSECKHNSFLSMTITNAAMLPDLPIVNNSVSWVGSYWGHGGISLQSSNDNSYFCVLTITNLSLTATDAYNVDIDTDVVDSNIDAGMATGVIVAMVISIIVGCCFVFIAVFFLVRWIGSSQTRTIVTSASPYPANNTAYVVYQAPPVQMVVPPQNTAPVVGIPVEPEQPMEPMS
eukprot:TRINITY_DN10893_c0_g1_i4.p1 TRINITY_DN10893_c0_g1~~TRINITY_DN10893_c0_g1_i4.p1  ORF type:complete len:226 (+),score=18.87 TRINITY_DN10893_c0_g1_i4:73-750(+)